MRLTTVLIILVILVAVLWIAQPWLKYLFGFAKPKANVEIAYSSLEASVVSTGCAVNARILLRNIGDADAVNTTLTLLAKDDLGNVRHNALIEADGIRGNREMKNVTYTFNTPCEHFYQDGKITGKSFVQLTGFQTAG